MVPGVLIGLGLMLVTLLIVRKKEYVVPDTDYGLRLCGENRKAGLFAFHAAHHYGSAESYSASSRPTEAGCVATPVRPVRGVFRNQGTGQKKRCYQALVRTAIITAVVL